MIARLIILFLTIFSGAAFAQSTGAALPGIAVNFGNSGDLVNSLQLVGLLTILTLAPAILILCTCFTRIIIVLSFLRQAIGTQSMPPNQLLVGFALFLTMFVMKPTGTYVYNQGVKPYLDKEITSIEAMEHVEIALRSFMNKQVRKADIGLFYDLSGEKAPRSIDKVPLTFLIPAFIISELKTAFQIGFLLYIPFLILDMIVASVLMAMGMMMLPPVVISLPFKLLLFVLVDGWQLITGSILRSFN